MKECWCKTAPDVIRSAALAELPTTKERSSSARSE